MCGIYGMIRTGKGDVTPAVADKWATLARALAVGSTARGTDSAGAARVDLDGAWQLVKDAVPAWDLFPRRAWNDATELTDGVFALVGHTRWATHGHVTAGNAHPFAFDTPTRGKFIGVHNGIINNHAMLRRGRRKVYAVDSANLFAELAKTPDAMEKVLKRAEGSLAIAVIMTEPEPSVTLTRNLGNPIAVAYAPELGAVVFASTDMILIAAANAAKVKLVDRRSLVDHVLVTYRPEGVVVERPWSKPVPPPKKTASTKYPQAFTSPFKTTGAVTVQRLGNNGLLYGQCAGCGDWVPNGRLQQLGPDACACDKCMGLPSLRKKGKGAR